MFVEEPSFWEKSLLPMKQLLWHRYRLMHHRLASRHPLQERSALHQAHLPPTRPSHSQRLINNLNLHLSWHQSWHLPPIHPSHNQLLINNLNLHLSWHL